MRNARFWMLAASAVLVTAMLLVVVLWPDILGDTPTDEPGDRSEETADPLGGPAPAFAADLGEALSEDRRNEMESLVAEYADTEEFDVADGACARCHEDVVPYDAGTDPEVVLQTMAEMHEAELGPEQTAEILAYFTGYRP